MNNNAHHLFYIFSQARGITGAPLLHKPLILLGSEGDSEHGLLLEIEGEEGKLMSVSVFGNFSCIMVPNIAPARPSHMAKVSVKKARRYMPPLVARTAKSQERGWI